MSRLAQNIKFVRRGGIYCARRRVSEANRHAAAALRPENPPAEPRAATNRADMESPPTEVCGIAGFACSRLVTSLAPVRRGGIYPARGCSRRREAPGTMRASSPTEVCGVVKFVVSQLAASFSPVCRGGPWPSRGRLRQHRGPRDDASIVPYRGLQHCRVRVFPVGCHVSPFRRAGVYARRTSKFAKKTLFCAFLNVQRFGGRNRPPCRARQTLYRQETNAFLNRLTHPFCGWVFCARRRALVFRHGSR